MSTVIIIFVMVEFLPKSIFRNNPNFYYRALAGDLFLLPRCSIRSPASRRSYRMVSCAWRGAVSRSGPCRNAFGRDDLAALLDTNTSEPRPEPDNEFKLFQNALDFADLRVRDCMVPRVDVEAVDIDDTSIGQPHGAVRRFEIFAYFRLAQEHRQHRRLCQFEEPVHASGQYRRRDDAGQFRARDHAAAT